MDFRFRAEIGFEVGDTIDSIVIYANSLDDLREDADEEIRKRGGRNPYTIQIEEDFIWEQNT